MDEARKRRIKALMDRINNEKVGHAQAFESMAMNPDPKMMKENADKSLELIEQQLKMKGDIKDYRFMSPTKESEIWRPASVGAVDNGTIGAQDYRSFTSRHPVFGDDDLTRYLETTYDTSSRHGLDMPITMKAVTDGKQIAHMGMTSTMEPATWRRGDYVSFMGSSMKGSREKVTDRLMMEALARNMAPFSSNISKETALRYKKILSTNKQAIYDMIDRFVATGKAGKIWQYVPLAGTGVAAYSAFKSGDAVAGALELADPTGISQSDPIEGGDLPEDEQIKRAEMNQLVKSRRVLRGN